MKINPARWLGYLFYDSYRTISRPHPYAYRYWIVWTCLVPLVPFFPQYAPALFLMFIVPELTAVYLDTLGKGKWTYSQSVWFTLSNQWARVLWGLVLSVIMGTYMVPWAGMLLGLWLIPHFAYRGRT